MKLTEQLIFPQGEVPVTHLLSFTGFTGDFDVLIESISEDLREIEERLRIYLLSHLRSEIWAKIPSQMYREIATLMDEKLADETYETRLVLWTMVCNNLHNLSNHIITKEQLIYKMKHN